MDQPPASEFQRVVVQLQESAEKDEPLLVQLMASLIEATPNVLSGNPMEVARNARLFLDAMRMYERDRISAKLQQVQSPQLQQRAGGQMGGVPGMAPPNGSTPNGQPANGVVGTAPFPSFDQR